MILDERLEATSVHVTELKLCQVRLVKNAAFPWILLVPKRDDLTEIVDLDLTDQHLLMSEIVFASHVMRSLFVPEKLNVASIGNMVPQLHVHIVARFERDKAWPAPVWNSGVDEQYEEKAKTDRVLQLKTAFEKGLF